MTEKNTDDQSNPLETSLSAETDECDTNPHSHERPPVDRPVEDVYLCFGHADSSLPKSAVQLILDVTFPIRFPSRARLIASAHDGRRSYLARVHVDIYHQRDRLPPQIEISLIDAARRKSSVKVTDDWQLYTWFCRNRDYLNLADFGPWRAEQVMRSVCDLVFASAVGHKPCWYNEPNHGALFVALDEYDTYIEEDLEDAYAFFSSAEFARGSNCERLARRLQQIHPGRAHARAFQQWVAEALTVLFPGLARVRTDANGVSPLQRDVVATNTKKGAFFRRLYDDYDVSMVVFEVKNYPRARAADFGQVQRYLNAKHYGSLGFLIVHTPTKTVPESSWQQMRTVYNEDGKRKLVIVLPSALLVELLDSQWQGSSNQPEEILELWLEEALLKHLYV